MSEQPAPSSTTPPSEQVQLAVQWALLHPCTDDLPRRLGRAPPSRATTASPAGRPRHPAGRPVRPRLPGRRPRHHPGRRQAADRRRPRARPTDSPASGPSWSPGWCRSGWPARSPARPTTSSVEAVAFADRLITAVPDKIRLLDAARSSTKPGSTSTPTARSPTRSASSPSAASGPAQGRPPATTDVFMTLDTPDAELFDQTISRIAHELHALGDTDDHRRPPGRAVGILADPQYALDLHLRQRRAPHPTTGTGSHEPLPTPHPRRPRPETESGRSRSRSSAPPPPPSWPTGSPATPPPAAK